MKHRLFTASLLVILSSGVHAFAQAPDGPQTDPPAAAARPVAKPASRAAAATKRSPCPAGTRIGVTLENGNFHVFGQNPATPSTFAPRFPSPSTTKLSFPSVRICAEKLLHAKRPGRVKGKGELRIG